MAFGGAPAVLSFARRLRALRLPARRWPASPPCWRRSTPARPSRAWARPARSPSPAWPSRPSSSALASAGALHRLALPHRHAGPGAAAGLARRRARPSSSAPSRSSPWRWPRTRASRWTIPNTHLELTMIHEVMVLDHSGPDLALILYGAAAEALPLRRAAGAGWRWAGSPRAPSPAAWAPRWPSWSASLALRGAGGAGRVVHGPAPPGPRARSSWWAPRSSPPSPSSSSSAPARAGAGCPSRDGPAPLASLPSPRRPTP